MLFFRRKKKQKEIEAQKAQEELNEAQLNTVESDDVDPTPVEVDSADNIEAADVVDDIDVTETHLETEPDLVALKLLQMKLRLTKIILQKHRLLKKSLRMTSLIKLS